LKITIFGRREVKKNYAEDKIKANGFESKDNFLFKAVDEHNNIAGYIWLCIRGSLDNRKAFICAIIIEEEFRGLGYGKMAMQLLEDEVKRVNIFEIGLHVFAFNKTAINLYKSLNYETTDLVMSKKLL